MRRPFVIRVQNDDPSLASGISDAVANALTKRGLRVRREDEPAGAGNEGIVRLRTSARGVRGTSIAIGIFDEENGARWLSPLEVVDDPAHALTQIMAFLETWGFIGAALLADEVHPASPS